MLYQLLKVDFMKRIRLNQTYINLILPIRINFDRGIDGNSNNVYSTSWPLHSS